MRRVAMMLAVGGVFAFGCAAQPEDSSGEIQEIIDNLVKVGYPSEDIMVVDGVVYVGRDAAVSLAASREMLQGEAPSKEQYRTTNLISTSVAKICINGSTFTGVFSTALNLAIQNFDQQPLTFAMARTPSANCSFTINAVIAPGVTGGFSGFPSGGLPFPTINIGDGLATFPLDTIEHVITHEIGHTIGFRHSDFFNRSISCNGLPVNEESPPSGLGAIHIPGTPTGATVGGSLMNSCFRTVETGELTGTDVTAIRRLYGPRVPLQFVDAASNALVTQPIQVSIQGPDRGLVTDANGVPTTLFTANGGNLVLQFATTVNPETTPLKIVAVVRRAGYVPTSAALTIAQVTTPVSVRMVRIALPPAGVAVAQVSGQADANGTVVAPIQLQASERVSNVTATVTVPAGTVITDATGAPLTGTLAVDGAYFSPTVGTSLAAFPGGFSVDTANRDGTTTGGEFVTAGLMSVEITDSSGRQAKSFSGTGIQIAMEIPADAVNPLTSLPIAPGDKIPVWSNDTATGQWSEENTITVTRSNDGRLVGAFNATHLSLWNLDFKVDRCPNIAPSTTFLSRRITVVDVFGLPVCAGKLRSLRVALRLVGGPAVPGYVRGFAPQAVQPEIIQFMNAPQVNLSIIQVFQDTNGNTVPDPAESIIGALQFTGPLTSENNLCPRQTNTATLNLFFPAAQVPGSC